MIALAWPFVVLVGLVFGFVLFWRQIGAVGSENTAIRGWVNGLWSETQAERQEMLERINAAEQRIGSLELRG